MDHTVTEKELSEWLCRPQWQTFASSGGPDGAKRFEIDGAEGGPVFRVTSRGEVVFLGASKAKAVWAYNNAR